MHLLDVHTYQLQRFTDERSAPPYAILSHTWADGKEVQYTDILKHAFDDRDDSLDWKKIDYTCQQAIADGFAYAWIDTCCIDKSSSAELSEAINSMFQWYRKAKVCYAYMADVGDAPVVDDSGEGTEASPNFIADPETNSSQLSLPTSSRGLLRASQLRESRWFTRGWTLQELIAPSTVVFYDRKWRLLGDRTRLLPNITAITGIPANVLEGSMPLQDVGIAVRMSWASRRETTRLEDEAYCLLGIFDINMPLLYGEGSKAFLRLQEEIMKVSTDHTIFAWNGELRQLLAPSPVNFANSGTIVPRGLLGPGEAPEMTSSGCRIALQLIPRKFAGSANAVLDCVDLRTPDADVCLPLDVCDELKSTILAEPLPHVLEYTPPALRYRLHHIRHKSDPRRQQVLIGHSSQNQDKKTSLAVQFALVGKLENVENVSYRLYPEDAWDGDTSTFSTSDVCRPRAVWVGSMPDSHPPTIGRQFLQLFAPSRGILVAWSWPLIGSLRAIKIHHKTNNHRDASQAVKEMFRELTIRDYRFSSNLGWEDNVLNYLWAQFHVSFRLEPVGTHQNGMTVVVNCDYLSDSNRIRSTLSFVVIIAASPLLLVMWLCRHIVEFFRRRFKDIAPWMS